MLLYLSLFIFSFVLTYLLKIYMLKKSLVDAPNERSSHVMPVPHGGRIEL